MPSPDPLFVIIFDHLSEERREVVQELLRENWNNWWWHRFPDVWVVGGHNAIFWRDLVSPIIRGTKSSVLVLRIPEQGEDRWAGFGTAGLFKWFNNAL
jgi:hypothetical protein